MSKHSVSSSGSHLYPYSINAHKACWHPALLLNFLCSYCPCPFQHSMSHLPLGSSQPPTHQQSAVLFLCLEHWDQFLPKTKFQSFLTLNWWLFSPGKLFFFTPPSSKSSEPVLWSPGWNLSNYPRRFVYYSFFLPKSWALRGRNSTLFIFVSLVDTQNCFLNE